jgi:predicted ATPase
LVEAEFLYQQGLPPQATYLFKHALIQDTAYQSLLRSTRQQHHQRIAQVLEARFPDLCETQPELLAHHYTEAGLAEQAIPHWQRAGQRATQRSAYVEAISHLSRGLALLKILPDTPERAQHELSIQTTLGPVLIAARGQGAPEVEQAYARARELCRQVGETPQLFPVLFGLSAFYIFRAEYHTARELAQQFLTLAQRAQDPAHLLRACYLLGGALFWLGELAPAHARMEQGIVPLDAQQHRALTLLYGLDPKGVCLSWTAWTLWLLGYPDQARARQHEALALAHELAHHPSLANAQAWASIFYAWYRDVHATQEQAEAAITLSTERGFPHRLAEGVLLQGWALVMQGQTEEGIAQIRQGMADWRATGAEIAWPLWLAFLAEAYGKAGQAAEGLTALAEARALVHKTEERFWEAELHRLTGELLLAQEETRATGQKVEEVETCFQQALAVARHQQAKSLELRAAVSLSRLWQRQGKRAEAHALLAPIYGWFTEGFDTADLQEARALLDELA